jgi:hypothetical protein
VTYLLLAGHISGDRDRGITNLLGDGSTILARQIQDRHTRAGAGEAQGRRAAKTARGPRDERNTRRKSHLAVNQFRTSIADADQFGRQRYNACSEVTAGDNEFGDGQRTASWSPCETAATHPALSV